jgi:hypothetical protein
MFDPTKDIDPIDSRHLAYALMSAVYVASRKEQESVGAHRWAEAEQALSDALRAYGRALAGLRL